MTSTTTTHVIAGITYTIIDEDTGLGLSTSDVQSILNNLHSTAAYTQKMNDLKTLSTTNNDPSLTEITIHIDFKVGDKYRSTGVDIDPTANEAININSSEFEDSANFTVTQDNQLMQNTVDLALAHEMGHLFDVRLNGAVLTGTSGPQEVTAIQFENEVRGDLSLPLRAENDHTRVDPAQYDLTRIATWFEELAGTVELLDPQQTAGINILGNDYYTGNASAMVPTTDANALVSTNDALAALMSLIAISGNNITTAVRDVSAEFTAFLSQFNASLTFRDPLIVDLNGDGAKMDNNISVYFATDPRDFNFAQATTTWMNANDGFLIWDENGNGTVDNSTEIFDIELQNAWESLAVHDLNADNVIDVNDAVWSELAIWNDANSDGITQESEFYDLADWDIVSIDLPVGLTGASVINTPRLEARQRVRQLKKAANDNYNVQTVRRAA
jgi:hypothetical protein